MDRSVSDHCETGNWLPIGVIIFRVFSPPIRILFGIDLTFVAKGHRDWEFLKIGNRCVEDFHDSLQLY